MVNKGKGGLPAKLKSGIEKLAGINMDRVDVHHNSTTPAELSADAFAEEQQQHSPREAWQVVQLVQGRVKPVERAHANPIVNDTDDLEREADNLGALALKPKF